MSFINGVTTSSIRSRILKDELEVLKAAAVLVVTTSSIRSRILKALKGYLVIIIGRVTTSSIRSRILKDHDADVFG